MIAVYLRPDATLLVRGRLQNKNKLLVQEVQKLPVSYLDDMSAEFFYDVRDAFKGKNEPIYLVLPDYLFSMLECFRYETEADIQEHIRQGTQRQLEDLSYAKPILTTPVKQEQFVTVCVLSRDLIQQICAAAEEAHARLVSIEAASISFLRASGVFNKEELVLTSFDKQATMTAYSSNAGLFKMDVPELSKEVLEQMQTADAERLIRQYMTVFESTANETFEYFNQNLPYTLLMDEELANSYAVFHERRARKHNFPAFVDASPISENEDEIWMPVAGTLLQDMDFSSDSFTDVLDSYENIASGNVLPEEVQKNTRKYQQLQDLTHYSSVAVVALFVIAVFEIAGIFFFSSTEIPSNLEADYKSAQSTMDSIQKELDIIHLQQQEHEYPVEAYGAMLKDLPQGIGFTSLAIGSEKKDDTEWIKVSMASSDPLKFQDYVTALSNDALFQNVSVPQMGSDSSTQYKTADLTIGKGKIAP